MKFYSEKLNRLFDTEKELHEHEDAADKRAKEQAEAKAKAEAERKAAAEKAELERKAKAEVRKQRAAEVEAALKDVNAAQKKYQKLLDAFCKDYGFFHTSISNLEDVPHIFPFPFDFHF